MISPEIIRGVESVEDAERAWPGILDARAAQGDPSHRFWRRFDPATAAYAVAQGSDRSNWTPFWNAACPAGDLMFSSENAVRDEREDARNGLYDLREDVEDHRCHEDAESLCAAVFRALVEGRLESEDPAYVYPSRTGVNLYWPFVRGERRGGVA